MTDEQRKTIRKLCDSDEQAAEVERIASMGRSSLETWANSKGFSLKDHARPSDVLQIIVDEVKRETIDG